MKRWIAPIAVVVLATAAGASYIIDMSQPRTVISDNVQPSVSVTTPTIPNHQPTVSPNPNTANTHKAFFKEGQRMGKLTIPKMKQSWDFYEGISQQTLKRGPGHYSFDALPGDVGNFAIAGHRTKRDFWFLHQVGAGDLIYVDYGNKRYTYKVYTKYIIWPDEVSVVDPNPEAPGTKPTKRLLTITTCTPIYRDGSSSSEQRLVVHAELMVQ